jgi:hypothetical protein
MLTATRVEIFGNYAIVISSPSMLTGEQQITRTFDLLSQS